jgi:hypothetical protein
MFKTFEVEEFYDMIAYAIREGLIFEANVCGDKARRLYIVEFAGGH